MAQEPLSTPEQAQPTAHLLRFRHVATVSAEPSGCCPARGREESIREIDTIQCAGRRSGDLGHSTDYEERRPKMRLECRRGRLAEDARSMTRRLLEWEKIALY